MIPVIKQNIKRQQFLNPVGYLDFHGWVHYTSGRLFDLISKLLILTIFATGSPTYLIFLLPTSIPSHSWPVDDRPMLAKHSFPFPPDYLPRQLFLTHSKLQSFNTSLFRDYALDRGPCLTGDVWLGSSVSRLPESTPHNWTESQLQHN